MKLYTLIECFDLAGRKFPFTVYWHRRDQIVSRTFYSCTENFRRFDTMDSDGYETWHYGLELNNENGRNYDASLIIYANDFDKIIKD